MNMINPSKIFEIYESENRKRIFTKNITSGKRFFNEKIYHEKDKEYREFDPRRSKLSALILKGCQNIFIRKDDTVLYLGASHGYTVSYISDIVGHSGFIFAIDSSARVVRDLYFLAKERKNIAPILADANAPKEYCDRVCLVDIVYQDIAQKNQAEIFLKNIGNFLKNGGYGILTVKARSINVVRKPGDVFKEVRKKLEKEVIIIEYRTLEPYQIDHCMFICKKRIHSTM